MKRHTHERIFKFFSILNQGNVPSIEVCAIGKITLRFHLPFKNLESTGPRRNSTGMSRQPKKGLHGGWLPLLADQRIFRTTLSELQVNMLQCFDCNEVCKKSFVKKFNLHLF